MQDAARTVTPHPCSCSKLAEQHKKRAALGWEREIWWKFPRKSSHVYTEEHPAGRAGDVGYNVLACHSTAYVCGTCWALKRASRSTHLPEEPLGSPMDAEYLPSNAFGVSTLSIVCEKAKSSRAAAEMQRTPRSWSLSSLTPRKPRSRCQQVQYLPWHEWTGKGSLTGATTECRAETFEGLAISVSTEPRSALTLYKYGI